MLNYIWAFMILVGIIYAAFTGNLDSVTNAALESAGEAVSLCIKMAGVMGLWMGVMEIARASHLIEKLARGLQPLLTFLFPKLPQGCLAREYIATNFIANILGLGWAATPAGLKAMEELAKESHEAKKRDLESGKHVGIASNEMCTFLIINMSSLQLIPVNIIAYRSQYGSVNPAAVIGPGLVATLVSTIVAVVFCKVMDKSEKG